MPDPLVGATGSSESQQDEVILVQVSSAAVDPDTQPLQAKQGEIAFRRQLIAQQVGGEQVFEGELSPAELIAVLRERMDATREAIGKLQRGGVAVTPYVELGSERCQRTLVLENQLGARGAALDISLDMLEAGEHYGKELGLPRQALRICCDVTHIPIRSRSVPFVFCYETLHHFHDPRPAIAEAHRILLPGGTFFLDEEPYRRLLHLPLYTVRNPGERGLLRRVADFFFAEHAWNEDAFGIIENHDSSVGSWRAALSAFAVQEGRLHSLRRKLGARLSPGRPSLRTTLATLLGGHMSATCRKAGEFDAQDVKPIEACLICPACQAKGREVDLPFAEGAGLSCTECGESFPVRAGVAVLLEPSLRRSLYPELG